MQAAVLHDTVEDTDTSFEELEKVFGLKVKNIIQEVSDDKSLPKAERKRLQVIIHERSRLNTCPNPAACNMGNLTWGMCFVNNSGSVCIAG